MTLMPTYALFDTYALLFDTQVEIAKRSSYHVEAAGAQVYRVTNLGTPDGETYEMDLSVPSCCSDYSIHLQPCRHMVPVFFHLHLLTGNTRRIQNTLHRFWPKWAFAKPYLEAYKGRCVHVPDIYTGPYLGPEADKVGVPLQTKKKPGRPKTKRYRSKPKTPRTVAQQMPTVYHAEYMELAQF